MKIFEALIIFCHAIFLGIIVVGEYFFFSSTSINSFLELGIIIISIGGYIMVSTYSPTVEVPVKIVKVMDCSESAISSDMHKWFRCYVGSPEILITILIGFIIMQIKRKKLDIESTQIREATGELLSAIKILKES